MLLQTIGLSLFTFFCLIVLCGSPLLSIATRVMSALQQHLGVLAVPCPTCFPSLICCSGKAAGLAQTGHFLELFPSVKWYTGPCVSLSCVCALVLFPHACAHLHVIPCQILSLVSTPEMKLQQYRGLRGVQATISLYLGQWITLLIHP